MGFNTVPARDLNVEAYTIVVSFCVRTNDFSLLRHFMEHAQKSQVVPDTILANTMLGIFVNIPSLAGWSAALQVFAMLRLQADTSTWNQLLALSDPCQKLIVFDRMQALAVPRDNVTLGSLIPLARAQYGSTHSFLENLDYGKWDPRLGDTLIGHLLSLRDSQTCIDLLKNTKFPVTIEGYNQVISHLRKIPALKVNHQKLARTICQSLVDRGSAPNMDTFLFLFRLSGFIRTKDYGDMIYNVACESGLASKELRLARKAQVRQRRRDAFVLSSPPISWRQWLAK
ncbi:protein of unknown function [Taphrina deformans PYCC 5710]|uniref:Pentatricopeptide repeat protein n=1 Tax=Taphrina deformans (strain PYCC 5710 / ATCC 11124 / CBS 356.35 / IMI 108563 / JCM 9778 / NBRC 8474) TaxID=1097556 RepID=R4XAE0_TAPDE|nr:protein of unknown function [Taphrina deformans PYCC 5710]|eukprot:CCG82727.1 protein of unknown function [Taphrina deformans PYCC 5710]